MFMAQSTKRSIQKYFYVKLRSVVTAITAISYANVHHEREWQMKMATRKNNMCEQAKNVWTS